MRYSSEEQAIAFSAVNAVFAIKKRPTGERRTKDHRRPEGLAGVKSLSLALLNNRGVPESLFDFSSWACDFYGTDGYSVVAATLNDSEFRSVRCLWNQSNLWTGS